MSNPALDQAKVKQSRKGEFEELSTGYRGKIIRIGATLIDEVCARVESPEVPKFYNEDKGREEENPNDPEYLRAVKRAERKRAEAAMDAMVMFGLELESLPEDDTWLKQLQFLERRGQLDLSGYDLEDPLDLEFVFKRYIAVGTADLIRIGKEAGLNASDVEKAANTFQSK